MLQREYTMLEASNWQCERARGGSVCEVAACARWQRQVKLEYLVVLGLLVCTGSRTTYHEQVVKVF